MRKILFAILAATTLIASPVYAGTERMPCKYIEAKISIANAYLWVTCPTEGTLMAEGQEVQFSDKRDFVVRSLKLIPLDGPVGSVATPINNKSTITELNKIKDSISALITKLEG